MSPIGDALDRAEENGATISSDAEVATSDHLASELSRMADNDSDLAKEVEARLRGAKVRFDGTSPTIETQPESGTPTPPQASFPSGAPRPGRQEDVRTSAGHASVAPVRTGARTSPARSPMAGQALTRELAQEQAQNAAPAHRSRYAHAGKVVRAIPFVLIFMFLVLGFDRTVSVFGALFGLTFGALIVVMLVVATSRIGRKTTSMPRDDRLRSPSRRRLP